LQTCFERRFGVFFVGEDFGGHEQFIAGNINFLQRNSQFFLGAVYYIVNARGQEDTFGGIEMTVSLVNGKFDSIDKRAIDIAWTRFVPFGPL
jgi:hypothetical protein